MQPTKRLFYVPGLISLLGLFIFLPSFYKKNTPLKEYGLPLFVPSNNRDKDSFDYLFSKYRLEKDISKKKKIKFLLDENKSETNKKMKLIRHEALKLKYTEDTSTVILITFTDSVSYGDFVSIVDMCEYDGHKRFASWDNKFVIFGEWPKRVEKSSEHGCLHVTDIIIVERPIRQTGFLESIGKQINDLYTPQGLYLLIGFLILLICFVFLRKKSIKTLPLILTQQAKR